MARPTENTRSKRPGSTGGSKRPGSVSQTPRRRKPPSRFGGITGFAKDFLKGGERAARGLPTGVIENAKMLAALQRGDVRPAARMAEQMGRQMYTDVRHPLRDPFSTFLTALSVASLGGGTAARAGAMGKTFAKTGSAGKAVKAAARKPTYTRVSQGMPKRPGAQPRTFETRASRNPVARGVRKVARDMPLALSRKRGIKSQKERFAKEITPLRNEARQLNLEIDKLTQKRKALSAKGMSKNTMDASVGAQITSKKFQLSKTRQEIADREKTINSEGPGAYARRNERKILEERTRFKKQRESAFPAEKWKDVPKPPRSLKKSASSMGLKDLWHLPMNILRTGMVTNPRYFLQNLGGSSLLLAMEQGPHGIAKSVNTARKVRKYNPEVAHGVRATLGDPGQGAAAIEATGLGGGVAQKAAHLANVPEARLRELAFYGAARARGITNPRDIQRLINSTDSNLFHQVAREASDAIVDYSRLGKTERGFMKSGVPIFYPMFKGFTRYGMQFPFEHSIQAAFLNQLGQKGYEKQQADFPGGLPPWQPYLWRASDTETGNLQNVHPFSPVADLAEAMSAPINRSVHPTRSLLNYVGPAPELLYGALSGNQFQTGWPLKGVDEGEMNAVAALRDFMPAVPAGTLMQMLGVMEPRKTKAYGKPTPEDLFWMWLFGPARPRKTNFAELRRGAKQAKNYRR